MTKFSFTVVMLLLCLRAHCLNITKEEHESIIDDLNDFRSKFANAARIANMYQLEYNELREQEAESFANSCPLPKKLKEQPHYEPIPSEFVDKYLEYTKEHLKDINRTDSFFGAKHYFSDVLRPLYMEVGCARLREPCVLKTKNSVTKVLESQRITVETVCIFGPYMEPAELDRIHGEPGSACVYGKGTHGLCKKASVMKAVDN